MSKGNEPVNPLLAYWDAKTLTVNAVGLTKREWLAGMAMQGFCSMGVGDAFDCVARWSVVQADALLAELEKDGAK